MLLRANLPFMFWNRAFKVASFITAILFAVVLAVMSSGPEASEVNLCHLTRIIPGLGGMPDACLHGIPPWVVQLGLVAAIAIALAYTLWPLMRRLWPAPLASLDNTIEFEWNSFAGEIRNPPDDHFFSTMLAPVPVEMVGGGGARASIGQGTIIHIKNARQCKVTNRSGVPIFNIDFELSCLFREAVQNPKSSMIVTVQAGGSVNLVGSGAELLRRPWRMTAAKIEADDTRPYVFYLENQNQVFVDVWAPKSITFQRLGSNMRETAVMLPPHSDHVVMMPPIEPVAIAMPPEPKVTE